MTEELMSLESRVVAAIANGYTTFSAIDTNSRKPWEKWRATDRELQKLRRRGVLKYSRKNGWSVAPIYVPAAQPAQKQGEDRG